MPSTLLESRQLFITDSRVSGSGFFCSLGYSKDVARLNQGTQAWKVGQFSLVTSYTKRKISLDSYFNGSPIYLSGQKLGW